MGQDYDKFLGLSSSSNSIASSNTPVEIGGGLPTAATNRPAFAVDGTKPLARVLSPVNVHSRPSPDAQVISSLEAEEDVEMYKLWKTDGGWMEIRLPDGSMGYMPAGTRVALLSRVKLKDKEVEVFEQPSLDGAPSHKLEKGSRFWTAATTAGPSCVRVRLDSGEVGYIHAATKVASLAQPKVPAIQSAGHDVIVGALWCIGGIAVTAGTYSAVSTSGGTYLICWGPIAFGGYQFLRGLFRAAVAEKAPAYGRTDA